MSNFHRFRTDVWGAAQERTSASVSTPLLVLWSFPLKQVASLSEIRTINFPLDFPVAAAQNLSSFHRLIPFQEKFRVG